MKDKELLKLGWEIEGLVNMCCALYEVTPSGGCYKWVGSILLVLVIINRGQILIGDMVNYIGDILRIGDLVKIGDRQKDRQKYWRF